MNGSRTAGIFRLLRSEMDRLGNRSVTRQTRVYATQSVRCVSQLLLNYIHALRGFVGALAESTSIRSGGVHHRRRRSEIHRSWTLLLSRRPCLPTECAIHRAAVACFKHSQAINILHISGATSGFDAILYEISAYERSLARVRLVLALKQCCRHSLWRKLSPVGGAATA